MTKQFEYPETIRFSIAALHSDTNDCIEWPFAINHGGYARIRIDGKEYRVHRLICQITHGSCPVNLRDAAHNCGNRKCINPKHIRWATRPDNCMDRVKHGTTNRGEKHGQVILTEVQVRKLRIAYKAGENISEIARQWGVNIDTAINASRGKTWKWLVD